MPQGVKPARHFGEFALMEGHLRQSPSTSAYGDFGVHPVSPENRDIIKPEPRPTAQRSSVTAPT